MAVKSAMCLTIHLLHKTKQEQKNYPTDDTYETFTTHSLHAARILPFNSAACETFEYIRVRYSHRMWILWPIVVCGLVWCTQSWTIWPRHHTHTAGCRTRQTQSPVTENIHKNVHAQHHTAVQCTPWSKNHKYAVLRWNRSQGQPQVSHLLCRLAVLSAQYQWWRWHGHLSWSHSCSVGTQPPHSPPAA